LKIAAGICLSIILLSGCSGKQDKPVKSDRKLQITVGIPPIAYIVEKIGGEHVDVDVLISPGQNPHTFEPTPSQVVKLNRSDLLFTIGLPFEERLATKTQTSAGKLQISRADLNIAKLPMSAEHGHGDEGFDPHIWLSPANIRQIALNIAGILENNDMTHAADYRQNINNFSAAVDSIDARIKSQLEPYRGRAFFVFHPAFGYFAEAYGLIQMPVELEGKSPSPRQLQSIIEQARAENIKTIFAQPQFDAKNAETVASAIGGKVIELDALNGDLLKNLMNMSGKIAESFREIE
jgi:zinc transport system substrate-binding protein